MTGYYAQKVTIVRLSYGEAADFPSSFLSREAVSEPLTAMCRSSKLTVPLRQEQRHEAPYVKDQVVE